MDGLRKLLEAEFELVAAVADGEALIEAATRLKPDLVLLDISMPVVNGFDAARRLSRSLPQTKLIFVTMHADPMYVAEAFRAGAAGYVLKRCAASVLVNAVHRVLRGERHVTPLIEEEALQSALSQLPHRNGAALTTRQKEILRLIAEGLAIKEIAAALAISVKTVEFHKAGIMSRLGIRTIAELTRYAIGHGLSQI
ncbi:MAG: response regulator transcription factor [Acidobacteria bacterium]|nr:response regulator transcription factor [Acidobacteriota bacterium]